MYPRDVEDGLLEHPAVEMAAVVGRVDALHGEEVVAFGSLRNGEEITGEELVNWVRLRIGEKYTARGAGTRLDPADAGGQDRPQSAAVKHRVRARLDPRCGLGTPEPRRSPSDRPVSLEPPLSHTAAILKTHREAYQIPSKAA